MEALEKRVEKCETKIDDLALIVKENSVNARHFLRVVEKFEQFSGQCTETLLKIQGNMEKLTSSYDFLQKEVCDIKNKVDENEDLNTVDLRKIKKINTISVITKISMILTPLGFIGLLLYLIFGV